MNRLFAYTIAVALLCGCGPITYQTRAVPVQHFPKHPLPAGATYAVVVPPSSIAASQLANSIQLPGFTRTSFSAGADVVMEANIGQPSVNRLEIESSKTNVVVNSSGGPNEFLTYAYSGSVSVPIRLVLTVKNGGVLLNKNRSVSDKLLFDADPQSGQRFTDPQSLQYSFNANRAVLLQNFARTEILPSLVNEANSTLADHFTTGKEDVWLTLATAHKTDARFAQAYTAFNAALAAPPPSDRFADRMAPALTTWEHIATSPQGENEDDKTAAKGAALYNQAVGQFLLGQLETTESTLSAAKACKVDSDKISELTDRIRDRRERLAAQDTMHPAKVPEAKP